MARGFLSRPARSALALLLLPLAAQTAPPPSDLTVVYAGADGRRPLRIEIAGNGDLRFQDNERGYFLTHDGHDYLVVAGPGGPIVQRYEDIAAARGGGEVEGGPGPDPQLIAQGEVIVNGRPGTAYATATPPPGPAPLVFSRDPALAPIGRAFAHRFGVEAPLWARSTPNYGAPGTIGDFFAHATPLRISGQELQSIVAGPIPASRFELPVPPEPPQARPAKDDTNAAREPNTMFKRAIFAEGRLWLLADNGALFTIAEGDKAAVEQASPEPVLDICLSRGAPVTVTGQPKSTRWTMRRRAGDGWSPIETVDSGGDALVAMSCTGNRRTLLTDKRLIDLEGGRAAVKLSEPLRVRGVATVHDAGATFFLGIDAGEWGGGLRRIDRRTGAVTPSEKHARGDNCKGPLSGVCDPVNAIAPEPGKPGCLVVAIGLVHFMPHGRLTEVCGERVKPLYYKPYTLEVSPRLDPNAPEPFETVAFYGLAPVGDAVWAVGLDGLYRIGADGNIAFRKMPPMENAGGVWLSFAVPGLVLVETGINGRLAMSGAVPMIVAR